MSRKIAHVDAALFNVCVKGQSVTYSRSHSHESEKTALVIKVNYMQYIGQVKGTRGIKVRGLITACGRRRNVHF